MADKTNLLDEVTEGIEILNLRLTKMEKVFVNLESKVRITFHILSD